MLPRRRFHPAADFTPPQIPPRRRFHPAPDFAPLQISPRSRFHPAPDFTPHQISPRTRFHPAPDFTPPQISPHSRFHGHAGFKLCQISGIPRPTFRADSASRQSRRAPRFHPPQKVSTDYASTKQSKNKTDGDRLSPSVLCLLCLVLASV